MADRSPKLSKSVGNLLQYSSTTDWSGFHFNLLLHVARGLHRYMWRAHPLSWGFPARLLERLKNSTYSGWDAEQHLLRVTCCRPALTPGDILKNSTYSGWQAEQHLLWVTCFRPALTLGDMLKNSTYSRWHAAEQHLLWVTCCKTALTPGDMLQNRLLQHLLQVKCRWPALAEGNTLKNSTYSVTCLRTLTLGWDAEEQHLLQVTC